MNKCKCCKHLQRFVTTVIVVVFAVVVVGDDGHDVKVCILFYQCHIERINCPAWLVSHCLHKQKDLHTRI